MTETFDPFYGDPARREASLAGSVKGNLVAARHRYVLERWGRDTLDALVASLDGPARRLLAEPPLPMGWHPAAHLAQVDHVIFEGPMGGDMAQMRSFGYEIADYDLSTLYRVLFKVGTPGFIVRRLPVAYGTYVRGMGTLQPTVRGKSATVDMVGGMAPYHLCYAGMTGWIHAALVLSGGHDVTVEHAVCQHRGSDHCQWQLSWR